jgi:hypothetical protein
VQSDWVTQDRLQPPRPRSAVNSQSVTDVLLDGFIGAAVGAILGAIITGAATIWVFRKGVQQARKAARAEQSVAAAARLINSLYTAKVALKLLPYTDAPAGSPLSYGERGDRARPMLEGLRRALWVDGPLLTDLELARRFRLFVAVCQLAASTSIDQFQIHGAAKEADAYADHVAACLKAHIDEEPLPADAPQLVITAGADEQSVIIASATGPGRVAA